MNEKQHIMINICTICNHIYTFLHFMHKCIHTLYHSTIKLYYQQNFKKIHSRMNKFTGTDVYRIAVKNDK